MPTPLCGREEHQLPVGGRTLASVTLAASALHVGICVQTAHRHRKDMIQLRRSRMRCAAFVWPHLLTAQLTAPPIAGKHSIRPYVFAAVGASPDGLALLLCWLSRLSFGGSQARTRAIAAWPTTAASGGVFHPASPALHQDRQGRNPNPFLRLYPKDPHANPEAMGVCASLKVNPHPSAFSGAAGSPVCLLWPELLAAS